MKIYEFYLCKKTIRHTKYPAISEDNIFETKSGKYACLYGFTDSKEIASEFIEYRNMNIFKLKEVNMSKAEYEKFRDLYSDEELEYNSFGTSMVVNGFIKIKPVQLVTTNKEADIIHMDYDMIAEGSLYDIFKSISEGRNPDEFYQSVINFSNMFKHDIIEALKVLEFTNVMFDYFSPEAHEMPFRNFDEDKLIAYIRLFKNTYKEGVL